MKPIIGFGALNLDLIFEVEDLKSLSLEGLRLDPGKEGFGSDEAFESLSGQLKRYFATVIAAKSVTGYGREQYPTKKDLEEFFHIRRR